MKLIICGLLFLSAFALSQSLVIPREDIKDDLKKELDQLKEEVKKEIEKLKNEGKLGLAVGLQALEKKLEDLDSQLEKLNPQTEVGKMLLQALEGLIKKVEEDIKKEIKKLNGGYYDDDVKKQLQEEVEKLKKLANDEIEKLKKEGKGKLAAGLEALEKRVVDIETQLEKLNPKTDVGKALLTTLEKVLKDLTKKVEDEIKKLNGKYYDDDVKKTIQEELEKLKKLAHDEIEKLKNEGKGKLAAGLEALEKKLVDIEQQVEKLSPKTDVGKALLTALETILKDVEKKIEEEIKKLNGKYFDDDLKKQLQDELEKLKKLANDEIEKLKKEGKGKLAAGLEALEKRLVDIEQQVEKLSPKTDVGKALLATLETILKDLEKKIEDEIKKLNGKF